MDKAYQPRDIEQRQYQRWEKNGWFMPAGSQIPYCIVIPPPNVTGTLHMGHAFQDTIMDALIRYHRMAGRNTLWQPGTDHAGIATQMVVERQLNSEGTSRRELGREKFVQRVWEWKNESGSQISKQLRRMGASLDWRRERFTMDQDLSDAVRRRAATARAAGYEARAEGHHDRETCHGAMLAKALVALSGRSVADRC